MRTKMKAIYLVLLMSIVCMCSVEVQASGIEWSGTSGDLSWTLDSNGELYISGSGDYVYLDEDVLYV